MPNVGARVQYYRAPTALCMCFVFHAQTSVVQPSVATHAYCVREQSQALSGRTPRHQQVLEH